MEFLEQRFPLFFCKNPKTVVSQALKTPSSYSAFANQFPYAYNLRLFIIVVNSTDSSLCLSLEFLRTSFWSSQNRGFPAFYVKTKNCFIGVFSSPVMIGFIGFGRCAKRRNYLSIPPRKGSRHLVWSATRSITCKHDTATNGDSKNQKIYGTLKDFFFQFLFYLRSKQNKHSLSLSEINFLFNK